MSPRKRRKTNRTSAYECASPKTTFIHLSHIGCKASVVAGSPSATLSARTSEPDASGHARSRRRCNGLPPHDGILGTERRDGPQRDARRATEAMVRLRFARAIFESLIKFSK